MVLRACKRRTKNFTLTEERDYSTIGLYQCATSEASTSTSFGPPFFTLLELPVPLLHDILSRLPLLDILKCRCICKTFIKLLKDPYFSRIHLSNAPTLRTNLILQKNIGTRRIFETFTFDLNESTVSSCRSSFDCEKNLNNTRPSIRNGLPELSKVNSEFSFRANGLTLIGSCNGLLCFYCARPLRPFYMICNPILGERLKLPQLANPSALYTYENSSSFFGYCASTKRYKVVSFMWLIFTDNLHFEYSKEMVAYVHTLGWGSWRRVDNPTCPRKNSLDPLLTDTLHWINDTEKPSEIIGSFDLEREKFGFISPPVHFNSQYVSKLPWLNVSVLRGCLCIFYMYEDSLFDVWVMGEYGVRESWTKEFSIDMKFYCRLRVEDLYRPVKLFGNGDLWFISSLNSLVCFCPRKRTFKELRSIKPWKFELTAHDLSFVSLKDVVGKKYREVQNFRIRRRELMFDL
ncbi:F-box family protein [Striga asiatica]|uniref:F-box family protein n=1 Tax=Striga asiatica TaxID=4170 RepID=A0A5A7RB94_STRAF|nr:F-box family protein [Striga asiatica]